MPRTASTDDAANGHDLGQVSPFVARANRPGQVGRQVSRNHEETLEILRLARQANSADQRQRLLDEVVVGHMRSAHSMAARFRGRGVDYDDLVQVAYLGLVKAARGCDPDRCADFMQYATPTIMGELKRHFRDHAWSVRPPRRLQEIQPLLTATRNTLTQRLGRQPTSREVADAMGVDTEQVTEALVAGQGFSTTSLDPFSDGVINSGTDDPQLAGVENIEMLSTLFVSLTDRERKVLLLRYYLGWTQAEIGAHLGLSQMQISRTLRSAMNKLGRVCDDSEPLRSEESENRTDRIA
jgi:RNA polymerase sigma-B factor